jgi:hypothetical protein
MRNPKLFALSDIGQSQPTAPPAAPAPAAPMTAPAAIRSPIIMFSGKQVQSRAPQIWRS